MRTDSVRISSEALAEARKLIGAGVRAAYLPAKPNVFKNSKTAQDAHEAIRPTDVKLTPEKLKPHLEKDMLALYELIWRRFVASQMARERLHVRVARSRQAAKGRALHVRRQRARRSSSTASRASTSRKARRRAGLPSRYAEGRCHDLYAPGSRASTSPAPPPRYSEATLIKTLEAKGIGRPSTYATTVSTIQEQRTTSTRTGVACPVPLGRTVNGLLTEFFPRVIDVDFTARHGRGARPDRGRQKTGSHPSMSSTASSGGDGFRQGADEEPEAGGEGRPPSCATSAARRWSCAGARTGNTSLQRPPGLQEQEERHWSTRTARSRSSRRRPTATCPQCGGHARREERPLRPFHRVQQLS